MRKIRHVTVGGFLGAGKTSAVILLAHYVASKGGRPSMITNDQSVGLVDTVRGNFTGFALKEVTGSCFCCNFNGLEQASEALRINSGADVIIAEPVGSCTDLAATVNYPFMERHKDRYDVAPLSTLVDPFRLEQALGLSEDIGFSKNVWYIYLKQLEESDFIVINKIDLMDPERVNDLEAAVKKRFPNAEIFKVSCRTETGMVDWFDRILATESTQRPTMDVDYDIYADGEKRLGWLNASGIVVAGQTTTARGTAILHSLSRKISDQLAEQAVEIAHLKMSLVTADGRQFGAIGLTGTDRSPHSPYRLNDVVPGQNELRINLRAETDPKVLEEVVRKAVTGFPQTPISLTHVDARRPGRPTPTHRTSVTA